MSPDTAWRRRAWRVLAAAVWLVALGIGEGRAVETAAPESAASGTGTLDRVGTQWAPYLEWSLHNPTWEGNPYDLVARVAFVHTESGKRRTTGMFYDGENVWKFRFTGTQEGEWRFTTSSEDADLDGKEGRVVIEPNPNAKAHGFLTHFGNKWGWEGTEEAFVPQLVMYAVPRHFYGKPEMVDADIETFLVEHGFNGLHIPVWCAWFDIEEDGYDNLPEEANPDRRTFEALEMVITKVHAAGGMVHLWAWGDEQRHWTPNKWGKNGKVDKRLQRYIAARLGPLPGWSMGYGFDCIEWVKEKDLREWHAHMHEQLGWFHFLGARAPGPHGPKDPVTQIYEGLDYSSYEQHRPTYEDYVRVIEAWPEKPSFSEDRFRVREEPRYASKDYTVEQTRRGLWHSAMAGGVANIWGYMLDPYKEAYLATGKSGPYPNPEWIKTNAEFFRGRFLKEMVRDNGLTDGVCLRAPDGSRYLFYKEDASAIRMDLRGMGYKERGVAVDAKAPYGEIDLGWLEAKEQVWKAPYESDWAIAVGAFER